MTRLYHITTSAEADAAQTSGTYEPGGFAREGFIHCSYARQVTSVANRLFRGQANLVLLEIDPSTVEHRIVDENLEGGDELFPHIYGRLAFTSVVAVHPFPCDAAGEFAFPAAS